MHLNLASVQGPDERQTADPISMMQAKLLSLLARMFWLDPQAHEKLWEALASVQEGRSPVSHAAAHGRRGLLEVDAHILDQ